MFTEDKSLSSSKQCNLRLAYNGLTVLFGLNLYYYELSCSKYLIFSYCGKKYLAALIFMHYLLIMFFFADLLEKTSGWDKDLLGE